jgi:NOL1/NOP2/sun family putative RNA methylase
MTLNEVKGRLSQEFLDMLYAIYSPGIIDDILRSYREGRKTALRVNTLKTSVNQVLNEFRENGIKFTKSNIANEALTLPGERETRVSKLSCYDEGKIYVQNLSSMLPPLFLDLEQGVRILDMCAAPGSKTTEIAAMIGNRARIVANELNEIRRERLKYNTVKQGASCVEVIGEDGRKLGKLFKESFDRVLLDAPCSGEGTFYMKNPESYRKWSRTVIRKNSKLQRELLESGINALKPGGILVYSTCTISPEENEEVVDATIGKFSNIKLMELDCKIKKSMAGITEYRGKTYSESLKKALRIIPGDEMEGFFLCKIRKNL